MIATLLLPIIQYSTNVAPVALVVCDGFFDGVYDPLVWEFLLGVFEVFGQHVCDGLADFTLKQPEDIRAIWQQFNIVDRDLLIVACC